MTNNNEETKAAINLPEQNLATEQRTKKPNFHPIGLTFLSLVLTIIALLLAIYLVFVGHYSSKKNEQQIEALNQNMLQLKQEQEAKEEHFNSLKEKMHQSETILKNQLRDLDQKLQSTIHQGLYQKNDWILLKARYLLELAQINAHWSMDQQATIALLQQADNLLAPISEQKLFTLRQIIANEISVLKALPKLDLPGLLSQLDAIQNAVAKLPIKQSVHTLLGNNAEEKKENSNANWRQQLKHSMYVLLNKLVVIHHQDESKQPLLSPLHRSLWLDDIRLNLQEAQWAVLQANPEVYQLALKQAIQAISLAFDVNTPATKSVIQQLEALKEKKFQKPTVTVEKSLTTLNQIIENQNTDRLKKPQTSGEQIP